MLSKRRWALLPVLLALTACTPRPPAASGSGGASGAAALPDTAQARAIAASVTLCRTTDAELRSRLGPPNRDGILHGKRVLTWFVHQDSPQRFLVVLLDSAGVVVDDYWDVPEETPVVLENRCGKGQGGGAGG